MLAEPYVAGLAEVRRRTCDSTTDLDSVGPSYTDRVALGCVEEDVVADDPSTAGRIVRATPKFPSILNGEGGHVGFITNENRPARDQNVSASHATAGNAMLDDPSNRAIRRYEA